MKAARTSWRFTGSDKDSKSSSTPAATRRTTTTTTDEVELIEASSSTPSSPQLATQSANNYNTTINGISDGKAFDISSSSDNNLSATANNNKSIVKPDRPIHSGLHSDAEAWDNVGQHRCRFCPYTRPVHRLYGFERFRAELHLFLDEPSSSKWANWWSKFITCLVVLTVVSFCLETLQGLQSIDREFWEIEIVVVLIFTFEYLGRLCSCSNRVAFMIQLPNVVDLLSIIPFYIDEIVRHTYTESAPDDFLIALRSVRLIRVARHSVYYDILGITVSKSLDAFGLLLFLLSITTVILSSFMYFAERGDRDGQPSPFTSIPATFYWCIVTLATLGYGDVTPVTPIGKLIASFTALCGILVIALPISIIGTNFSDAYKDFLKKQEDEAELLRQKEKLEREREEAERSKDLFFVTEEDGGDGADASKLTEPILDEKDLLRQELQSIRELKLELSEMVDQMKELMHKVVIANKTSHTNTVAPVAATHNTAVHSSASVASSFEATAFADHTHDAPTKSQSTASLFNKHDHNHEQYGAATATTTTSSSHDTNHDTSRPHQMRRNNSKRTPLVPLSQLHIPLSTQSRQYPTNTNGNISTTSAVTEPLSNASSASTSTHHQPLGSSLATQNHNSDEIKNDNKHGVSSTTNDSDVFDF